MRVLFLEVQLEEISRVRIQTLVGRDFFEISCFWWSFQAPYCFEEGLSLSLSLLPVNRSDKRTSPFSCMLSWPSLFLLTMTECSDLVDVTGSREEKPWNDKH